MSRPLVRRVTKIKTLYSDLYCYRAAQHAGVCHDLHSIQLSALWQDSTHGRSATATRQHAWDVINTEVKHIAIRQLDFEHVTPRVRETDETTVRGPPL